MVEKYLIYGETSENPDFSRRKSGVRVPSAPPRVSVGRTFNTSLPVFGKGSFYSIVPYHRL
ncbi:MAG TPA: hypothetical protein G4O15_01595 [Dehalococcoidia bacterium]|nr:hypothetical protein [Dehalococcoidia bacterium]